MKNDHLKHERKLIEAEHEMKLLQINQNKEIMEKRHKMELESLETSKDCEETSSCARPTKLEDEDTRNN